MSGHTPWRRSAPQSLHEAAAAWALLQDERDLTDSEQARFGAWLASDETHVDAYEDAVWALEAAVRHASSPELMDMRKAALEARGASRRPYILAGLSASAAAAAAAVSLMVASPTLLPATSSHDATAPAFADARTTTYSTAIGERSSVKLPDGSVVTLDTDSRIRLAYSDRERGIYLDKGQALFEVAHGRPQPFRVYAKGQRVTAVGTAFNVRIEGREVRVAIVEGTVQISPAASAVSRAPRQSLTLTAGEALVAEPSRPMRAVPVDVRQAVSWKGGLLVFNDTPLGEAVAEINRYTTRPIAIVDSSVGNYRVSGVFKSSDPVHFARAMTEIFPIELEHSGDGAPMLRARPD